MVIFRSIFINLKFKSKKRNLKFFKFLLIINKIAYQDYIKLKYYLYIFNNLIFLKILLLFIKYLIIFVF